MGEDGNSSSVRLFGVCLPPPSSSSSSSSSPLTDFNSRIHGSSAYGLPGMRKCMSMGNISCHTMSSEPRNLALPSPDVSVAEPPELLPDSTAAPAPSGYLSDCLVHSAAGRLRERKKGVPWTEDEHRLFLMGLQKLGKGDWRGISKTFVITRTPTQVASHAQKYFLRQSNINKRKRRSSLFDIISDPSNMACPSPPSILKQSMNTHYHAQKLSAEATELNRVSPASLMIAREPATESPISADLCLGFQHPWQQKLAGTKSDENAFHRQSISTLIKSASASTLMRLPSSLSPTPSSASSSSLCRIDEAVELSSLNLSIAPPCSPSSAFKDPDHHCADFSSQQTRSSSMLVQSVPATTSTPATPAASAASMVSPNANSSMAKAIISVI